VAAQDEERSATRLALNESAHRTANERFVRTASSHGYKPTDQVPLVCECGAPICREIVMLTIEVYEYIRAHPTWFLRAADHVGDDAALERIVGRREHAYVVVEKIGSAGAEAARRDPRASNSDGVTSHNPNQR
jgi:hypothetical protein